MIQKLKQKLTRDENLKELFEGSAITLVIKLIGMLLGYLVVLIISRKYGAEGTGIYTLTTRLLNFSAMVGALGLNISVLRYVGEFNKSHSEPTKLKTLFKYINQITIPFSILVGLVLYFSSNQIAIKVFNNELYALAFKIGAITLPFITLNLINVEFIRGLKLLKVSESLRSITKHLVVLIFLSTTIFHVGIINPIIALMMGFVITLFLSLVYIINHLKSKKAVSENDFSKKELLKTSFPMMITSVFTFVLAEAGGFFLEIYSTTDKVGIYNVCITIAQLVGLVLIVVNTISAPKFSELFWKNKLNELRKLVRQSTKMIFWISLVTSLLIVIFSKFILSIFGEEFIYGVSTLIILIFGQLVHSATGSVGILLNMSGHQIAVRNILIITTMIVITSYLILVPAYGIIGAAVSTVIGYIVVNTTSAMYAYRKLGINTTFIVKNE